ncbi:MAG: Hpt domain-containing protein [Clostridiales Family XIII bacterium]|jgi:hypothetical protein|nr:Hpt domain-containing protein [Clostridiales Family XIII bacterium]
MRKTEKQNGSPHRDEALTPTRVRLLMIGGLDTDIGLLNSGGKLCVYKDILSNFCRDTEEKEERLRQAARRGNAALCIILLHALKDEFAGIGAIGLARRALWLAEAAKNGELADMRDRMDALLKDKGLLIERIHAALTQSVPSGEARVSGPAYLRVELSRIVRGHAHPGSENALRNR